MRTAQPTIVLNHFRNWGRGWARKIDLSPQYIITLAFLGGICIVVFGVGFGDVSRFVCTNCFS